MDNYMSRDEFIHLVRAVALEVMEKPFFDYRTSTAEKATLTELANRNSLVAMHNRGVVELTEELIRVLAGKEEENGQA